MLVDAAYGKSSVRLVKVSRNGDRHDLIDLTVAIRFEGDYDASYSAGDNSGVLPTDTMKNTVYALAARRTGRGAGGRSASRLAATSSSGIPGCIAFASISPSSRGAGFRSATASTARRSCDPAARSGPRPFSAIGCAARVGAGIRGPRDPQVVAFRVHRLPPRRAHDAARDHGSPAGDVADRDAGGIATRNVDFGASWRAVRATLLEPSPSTTANRCSTPSTRWDRPCSTTSTS